MSTPNQDNFPGTAWPVLRAALPGPLLLELRPEGVTDETLLYELYAETRAEELAGLGWDAVTRQGFLSMQFKAQQQGYHTMFPKGDFAIILARGEPIGRIVVDWGESEIRLVDLALLAASRGQGIGTHLLRGLCDEAAAARKTLLLHVLRNSRAKTLYARLGFVQTDDSGVYQQMEWRPSLAA